MTRKFWLYCTVSALALGIACARESGVPSSPSAIGGGGLGAAADGTTLKASAPTPVSPLNGVKLDIGATPTLVINNSTLAFGTAASSVQLTYRFRVFNAAGATIVNTVVPSGTGATTSYNVTAALDGEQIYTWDARAEYSGTFTAYTQRTNARFETPASFGVHQGQRDLRSAHQRKDHGHHSRPGHLDRRAGHQSSTTSARTSTTSFRRRCSKARSR